MLKITEIKVISFDISHLDIYWKIAPSVEDTFDYTFTVQKSYNELGPYFDLTAPLVNVYHIRDNTVKGQHAAFRKNYYRIAVKKNGTAENVIFPETQIGVSIETIPSLIALEIARQNRLKYKIISGTKLWILPRRTFGQRCRCYDAISNRRLFSNCATCYDTGWVKGYDNPIETYAELIRPNETTFKLEEGTVQIKNGQLKMGNYPEIFTDWIIIDGFNNRWRIGESITKIRRHGSIIKQIASVHEIPKTDIEYTIPLNITNEEDLVILPETAINTKTTVS